MWLADRPDVWDTRWWSPVGRGAGRSDARGRPRLERRRAALRQDCGGSTGCWRSLHRADSVHEGQAHLHRRGLAMLRDPLAAQRLPRVPAEQSTSGVQYITDFTWKQLLNLDACTKCGRCHEACPARAVGRAAVAARCHPVAARVRQQDLEYGALPAEARARRARQGPGQVAMETLWSCRTCMACVEVCPVAVEHVPIIVQMRRKLVEDGEMDPQLKKTLQTHPQERKLIRRVPAQTRRVDQVAAVHGEGCAQGAGRACCGSSATTPRSIRATRR